MLFQQGRDSTPDGRGLAVRSGGGYGQLSWAFSPEVTGIARFDSVYDGLAGHGETLTTSLVLPPLPNARLTIEDVSGSGHGALSAAWLIAY